MIKKAIALNFDCIISLGLTEVLLCLVLISAIFMQTYVVTG